MVELLDFTLGIVAGIIIGVVTGFFANYFTDLIRERKRHKRVVNAFIKELTMISDYIKTNKFYMSVPIGTPVFSKLITELPLLKELTAEELLNTYSEIKFYLRPEGSMTTSDLKKLSEAIETSIMLLRKEVKHKSRLSNQQ